MKIKVIGEKLKSFQTIELIRLNKKKYLKFLSQKNYMRILLKFQETIVQFIAIKSFQ